MRWSSPCCAFLDLSIALQKIRIQIQFVRYISLMFVYMDVRISIYMFVTSYRRIFLWWRHINCLYTWLILFESSRFLRARTYKEVLIFLHSRALFIAQLLTDTLKNHFLSKNICSDATTERRNNDGNTWCPCIHLVSSKPSFALSHFISHLRRHRLFPADIKSTNLADIDLHYDSFSRWPITVFLLT